MTEHEAINELLDYVGDEFKTTISFDAVTMARKALEKQIPKKPEEIYKAVCCEDIEAYGEDALFGYCPECNNLQCDVWNQEYCGDCGQKLYWTD